MSAQTNGFYGTAAIATAALLASTACTSPAPAPRMPVEPDLPVTLEAPDQVGEGQAFEISWSGPDHLGATIGVSRVDDPPDAAIVAYSALKARRNFERTLDAPAAGLATTQMAAPPIAGDYEIRYTRKLPNVILARRPLRVIDTDYELVAPDMATVASPVKIEWSGTLTAGDFVTLVPKGYERPFDNDRYAELEPGKPARLMTPAAPGEYEIRYVMNASYSKRDSMRYAVQAAIPIVVTDVAASVAGPQHAVGGSTIDVQWQGPADGWQDDVLSIVPRGSGAFNRDSWAKVARDGSANNPAAIRVPAVAGDYDIAYVLVPGERIIARAPLTVTRARASIEAPDRVVAGRDFEVRYAADVFEGDRVVVVRAEFPDDKMWGIQDRYGFAAEPSARRGVIPGTAVTEPGSYEVRYVTGLQHQVLARAAVTVTE